MTNKPNTPADDYADQLVNAAHNYDFDTVSRLLEDIDPSIADRISENAYGRVLTNVGNAVLDHEIPGGYADDLITTLFVNAHDNINPTNVSDTLVYLSSAYAFDNVETILENMDPVTADRVNDIAYGRVLTNVANAVLDHEIPGGYADDLIATIFVKAQGNISSDDVGDTLFYLSSAYAFENVETILDNMDPVTSDQVDTAAYGRVLANVGNAVQDHEIPGGYADQLIAKIFSEAGDNIFPEDVADTLVHLSNSYAFDNVEAILDNMDPKTADRVSDAAYNRVIDSINNAVADHEIPEGYAHDLVGKVFASEPALYGDFNGDGFVGQSDLNFVLTNWGRWTPEQEQTDMGSIGQNELDAVLQNWGNTTETAIQDAIDNFIGSTAVDQPQQSAQVQQTQVQQQQGQQQQMQQQQMQQTDMYDDHSAMNEVIV